MSRSETSADYAARTRAKQFQALTQLQAELATLRYAVEATVHALLPVLPLEGSWEAGYRVSDRLDTTVVALPEEWGDAAFAVAELQRIVTGGTP